MNLRVKLSSLRGCLQTLYHVEWNMKPSAETLEKFKRAYAKEFGDELSDQEAFEGFSRLLNVVRILTSGDHFPDLDTPEAGATLTCADI